MSTASDLLRISNSKNGRSKYLITSRRLLFWSLQRFNWFWTGCHVPCLKQKQQHLSKAAAVHAFLSSALLIFFFSPLNPDLIKTQVTSSYGTSITSGRHFYFTHNEGNATGSYASPCSPIMTVTPKAAAAPITVTPVLETRPWVTVGYHLGYCGF